MPQCIDKPCSKLSAAIVAGPSVSLESGCYRGGLVQTGAFQEYPQPQSTLLPVLRYLDPNKVAKVEVLPIQF